MNTIRLSFLATVRNVATESSFSFKSGFAYSQMKPISYVKINTVEFFSKEQRSLDKTDTLSTGKCSFII